MEILKSIDDLVAYRKSLGGEEVGFVPTMGALHDGHASLIERSRGQDRYTIVSIFVNPTQFGANEDLDKYPRTFEKDSALCERLGVSAIFAPHAKDMYRKEDEITLNPPKSMANVYEGALRMGHFNGVLQVVLKLFCLIRPKRAYFGQKDAQQLLIIKRMVEDLFLDVEIVPCPTKRDFDSLALSSRNVYLSEIERKNALQIPQALKMIKKMVDEGVRDSNKLILEAKKCIKDLELDYLDIIDYDLQKLSEVILGKSIVLIAARSGNTRLLDNLWL